MGKFTIFVLLDALRVAVKRKINSVVGFFVLTIDYFNYCVYFCKVNNNTLIYGSNSI